MSQDVFEPVEFTTNEQAAIKEIATIKAEVAPVVSRAMAMTVATPEQYTTASDFLKAVKDAQKKVKGFWAPIKAAANAAWKKTTEGEAALLGPLAEAETNVKQKMLAFQTEQERIRLAEQRRLQAIADEAARKERERADALARVQREKEAAAIAAAEEALARAAAADTDAEREQAQREAAKATRAANEAAAKAEAREEAAAMVAPAPVIAVASVAPTVKGQSLRKTWRAVVVELALVPREWMTVNEQALNAFARSTKGAVPLPGVKFVEDTQLSSSSK